MALALSQFQAGNRAEVEALCLKIMEVEPERPDALHLTGALAAYREAARLEPAHASAWPNLGNALLEGDRLDDAIAAYQQHLKVKPHARVYATFSCDATCW